MSIPTVCTSDVRLDHDQNLRFRVRFGSGAPETLLAAPPPMGAADGPDPGALLAAAVGGDLATSFLICARRARVTVHAMSVHVRLSRSRDAEGRPRIRRIHVHLVPDVGELDAARLRACLDDYQAHGPVTESVRQGIPVDVLLEPAIRRPARARSARTAA